MKNIIHYSDIIKKRKAEQQTEINVSVDNNVCNNVDKRTTK